MEIKVFATLRDIVGGQKIHVDDAGEMTIEGILQQIFSAHPALRSAVLDQTGELSKSIHILINGREVRYLDGLQTTVTPGDAVHIFPPVGGGNQ